MALDAMASMPADRSIPRTLNPASAKRVASLAGPHPRSAIVPRAGIDAAKAQRGSGNASSLPDTSLSWFSAY